MNPLMASEMTIYSGPDDLRAMQSLVEDVWDFETSTHIGDLAWGRFSHVGREAEWPTAIWMEDGRVSGWGWIHLPDTLVFMTRERTAALAGVILGWFEYVAPAYVLNVEILETERHLLSALSARGYVENVDAPWAQYSRRSLLRLPAVRMPDGFRARNMTEDIEFEVRAKAHQDAWSLLPFFDGEKPKSQSATSRVSAESCEQIAGSWPWRPELDQVIEAPDGTLAACCIIWLDEVNKVAELEPVGTHPEFRRMGLARAVCLSAMEAARDLGAEHAIVYPRGDAIYPVPGRTYAGLGFEPYGRTRTYELRR